MPRPITITAAGNAQVSTAQSKFGGASALFDGNLDYLSVSHGTDLIFGTGNFTFEMWFRPNAKTTQYPMLLTNTAGWGGNAFQLHDRHDSFNSKITFWVNNYAQGSPLLVSTTTVANGNWYHLAIVRNGTSFKMYVNGTEEASATSSVNIDGSTGSTYYAGGRVSQAVESYNGWIDELRISNSARYTSNFTPATTQFSSDANTLLLIHADGTNGSTQFVDATRPQIFTITGNTQISTAQSKFGGSSIRFDGSGDYLSTTYSVGNWKWNNSNYTVEMWAYFTAFPTPGGGNLIGLMRPNDGFNYWSFGSNGSGALVFYYYNGNTNFITGSNTFTLNTWHHLAMVYTTGDNTIRLFANGTQVASAVANAPQFQSVGDAPVTIGTHQGVTLNGYLDEIRVSNSARYTGNFTPSTTAFTNDVNTLLLMHADGTNGSTAIVDNTTDPETIIIEQGAASVSVISTIYCVPGDTDPFYIESGYIDAGYYESFSVLQEVESDLYVVANLTCSLLLIKNASAEFDAIANLSGTLQLFKNVSVELNATASVSCPIELIKNATIALTATASVSCTISHIEGADLFAFTEAAIAVQVDRIRDNNIAASAVFTVATDVERIQQGDADADAIFSAIINGLRSRDVNLETQAAFSFDVQEDLFKDFIVSLSSQSTVGTIADKFLPGILDIVSEFNVTTINSRFRNVNLEIFSEFSFAIDAQVIGPIIEEGRADLISEFSVLANTEDSLTKTVDSDLNSEFSLEANANYIVDNVIITDSIASILTAVVKTVAVDIPLDSNFVVGADISRIRGVEINVSAIAETTISAVKTTSTTDLLSSAFTQTAVAGRIRDVEITTEAIASNLTAVVRIAGLFIVSNVVSTLTANGVVTRGAQSEFTSTATIVSAPVKRSVGSAEIISIGSITAITGFRKEFNSDIASALTFVVAIRDLRLDEIVYVIPGENYVYEIISESRLHDIYGETRIRSVTGESRNRKIIGESRIHIID
jgi:hypothetical protein